MTTSSYAKRIAAQSIVVLNPDTESARRVFPTGEVEVHDGTEYVIFKNSHHDDSLVRESRPARQFGFAI